jgi:hypothetical protein
VILGFTGTRRGMTAAQRGALAQCVAAIPARAIHGGAAGADEEFDAFMVHAGMPPWDIDVYPSGVDRWLKWADAGRTTYTVQPPLVRNRIIVRRCDYLIAAPATAEEVVRSGTWMTVRRARKIGRPVVVLLPDGGVREEHEYAA